MAIARLTRITDVSLSWADISQSAGDLVILIIANDGGDNQTAPTGFARLGTDSGTSVEGGVYYKICTGSESGTIIASEADFGVSGENYALVSLKIPAAEWHGTTPPELTAVRSATGTIDPPSHTASWGSETNNLWIVAACRDDDDGISSLSAPYDANFGYVGETAQGCEIASSWRTNTSDAENPGTATQTNTNEEWIAWTIAVRPAAAGGQYYQSVTATAIGVAGVVKGTSKPLSATAVASAVVLKGTSKTLAATAVAVASVAKKTYQLLAATAVGSAVLVTAKKVYQTLTATAVGVAGLVKGTSKTLAATATATPGLLRATSKNIAAVAIGVAEVAKGMSKTLAATAIGVGIIAPVAAFAKGVNATAVGVAVLTPIATFLKILSATAIGQAVLGTSHTPGVPGGRQADVRWVQRAMNHIGRTMRGMR